MDNDVSSCLDTLIPAGCDVVIFERNVEAAGGTCRRACFHECRVDGVALEALYLTFLLFTVGKTGASCGFL